MFEPEPTAIAADNLWRPNKVVTLVASKPGKLFWLLFLLISDAILAILLQDPKNVLSNFAPCDIPSGVPVCQAVLNVARVGARW